MNRRKVLKLSGFKIDYSKNTGLNEFINNPNCTFLGTQCDQSFTAFFIWEKFFQSNGDIKRFLELGCDFGGTSVFFALWCYNIEADYHGFDFRPKRRYRSKPVMRLIQLAKKMNTGNLYNEKMTNKVIELIKQPGRSVLFCDCIDKPWEFKTFGPYLKKNDVVAVHDWDRAIKDKWVQKTILQISPVKLLYEDERLKLNTLTRFFLKE